MDDKLQVEFRRAEEAPDANADDLNADPELNRAVASTAFEMFSDLSKLSLEAGAATARWLLTIIVAINGGAAIAVSGLAMSPGFKVAAAAAFIVGILLALAASVAVLVTLPGLLKPVGEAMGYWLEVRHDGERVEDDYKDQQQELDAASSKAAVWSWGFGIAAMVLFIVGCVVAASGVLSATP